MKKTNIILLDAVREDMLQFMPYLSKLKQEHTYLTMIPSV